MRGRLVCEITPARITLFLCGKGRSSVSTIIMPRCACANKATKLIVGAFPTATLLGESLVNKIFNKNTKLSLRYAFERPGQASGETVSQDRTLPVGEAVVVFTALTLSQEQHSPLEHQVPQGAQEDIAIHSAVPSHTQGVFGDIR